MRKERIQNVKYSRTGNKLPHFSYFTDELVEQVIAALMGSLDIRKARREIFFMREDLKFIPHRIPSFRPLWMRRSTIRKIILLPSIP